MPSEPFKGGCVYLPALLPASGFRAIQRQFQALGGRARLGPPAAPGGGGPQRGQDAASGGLCVRSGLEETWGFWGPAERRVGAMGALDLLPCGCPLEFREYARGGGMLWHRDEVLSDPPQLELVYTLENTSDSVTRWAEGHLGVLRDETSEVWTEPNSGLLVQAGGAVHMVTELTLGRRVILKVPYLQSPASRARGERWSANLRRARGVRREEDDVEATLGTCFVTDAWLRRGSPRRETWPEVWKASARALVIRVAKVLLAGRGLVPYCWAAQVSNETFFGDTDLHCARAPGVTEGGQLAWRFRARECPDTRVRCDGAACIARWSAPLQNESRVVSPGLWPQDMVSVTSIFDVGGSKGEWDRNRCLALLKRAPQAPEERLEGIPRPADSPMLQSVAEEGARSARLLDGEEDKGVCRLCLRQWRLSLGLGTLCLADLGAALALASFGRLDVLIISLLRGALLIFCFALATKLGLGVWRCGAEDGHQENGTHTGAQPESELDRQRAAVTAREANSWKRNLVLGLSFLGVTLQSTYTGVQVLATEGETALEACCFTLVVACMNAEFLVMKLLVERLTEEEGVLLQGLHEHRPRSPSARSAGSALVREPAA
ncbi:unnamed protein product [Effrenium voratum]|nr:unnamed protein product [Effrenium voratum]